MAKRSYFNKKIKKEKKGCLLVYFFSSCLRSSAYVALMSSIEPSSSMVDVSPSGAPVRTAFRSLRMILPLRVFGSLLTMMTASGVAIGPMVVRTCFMSSARSSSDGVNPPRNTTNATGTSPLTASSLPITAASETAG